MNLLTYGKVSRVMVGIAAGMATNEGDSVDMEGFKSVTFIALIGDIAGGGAVTFKAQQSSDDGIADGFSDLLGTAIAYTDADDNKAAILEIVNPLKRYVRPVLITGGGNGAIDGVLAIQTGPNTEPVTHDAITVLAAELHASPAEGTA